MTHRPKIPPPVYFVATIIAMGALHFLFPIARVLDLIFAVAGAVLVVAGIAVSAYAAGMFKKSGTPVVPFERSTFLVTNGLYRVTRNPMYLGLIVALIGIAVCSGTVGALLPIPVFVWIVRTRFVAGEERFLEEIFGDSYLAYKRSV